MYNIEVTKWVVYCEVNFSTMSRALYLKLVKLTLFLRCGLSDPWVNKVSGEFSWTLFFFFFIPFTLVCGVWWFLFFILIFTLFCGDGGGVSSFLFFLIDRSFSLLLTIPFLPDFGWASFFVFYVHVLSAGIVLVSALYCIFLINLILEPLVWYNEG